MILQYLSMSHPGSAGQKMSLILWCYKFPPESGHTVSEMTLEEYAAGGCTK